MHKISWTAAIRSIYTTPDNLLFVNNNNVYFLYYSWRNHEIRLLRDILSE